MIDGKKPGFPHRVGASENCSSWPMAIYNYIVRSQFNIYLSPGVIWHYHDTPSGGGNNCSPVFQKFSDGPVFC